MLEGTRILIDTILLVLFRAGYTYNFQPYDIDEMYNLLCKYVKKLHCTTDNIIEALYYIDNECLDFDDNDNVRLKKCALQKAIRGFEGNDLYSVVVEISDELKIINDL